MSALTGAALALIGFVLTQGILKFVIEPIQEQWRLRGEVAQALSIYATLMDVHRAGAEEARMLLRSLSGRLWASLWALPFYDAFARLGVVLKANDVATAATELMILSETLTSPDLTMRRAAIAERLGITRRFGNRL